MNILNCSVFEFRKSESDLKTEKFVLNKVFFLLIFLFNKIPITLNKTKPSGSQTKLQCLIKQFSKIADYNQFSAQVNSQTICPYSLYSKSLNNSLNLYTVTMLFYWIADVNSISISNPSTTGQSDLTYDGKAFDWYFNDSVKNNSVLFKINEFIFQVCIRKLRILFKN